MKTVFYLKNCNTSKRVIKEADIDESFVMRDIKEERLTPEEIDMLAKIAGSYKALFSKKARKYREYNLHLENLTEDDYRKYLCEDYTFLKRPTIVIDEKIFVGSHRNTVKELGYYLKHQKETKNKILL
jgi:arsenate reductase